MLRTQFKRIVGNYLRLALGFIIGIFTVRLLLGFGNDIFNIYTLVTVGAGIGIMLRELLRIALVPRMTTLWVIDADSGDFNKAYKQASALSQVSLVIGIVLMVALAWVIPSLDIHPQNADAARIFVLARAAIMVSSVFFSPLFAMQFVEQKFAQANAFMTIERLADFVAVVLAAIFLNGSQNGADHLILFAFFSAFLTISIHIFYARHIMSWSHLPLPWSWPNFGAIGSEFATSAFWAFILVMSFNLYLRFDAFFVNLMIGATATIAFGLAAQLLGMVRQLTYGIANGLDAVIANFAFRQGSNSRTQDSIIHLSSYLQSLFTGYSVVFMFLCSGQLMHIWVGNVVSDTAVIPLAAHLSSIMLIGMGARSLSESWMSQLNGLGKIGSYTKFTLPVTLLNPLLLILASFVIPKITIEIVAYLFVFLLCISHLIIVPWAVIRETNISLMSLFHPIFRGLVSLPVAMGLSYLIAQVWNPAAGIYRVAEVAVILSGVALVDLIIYITNIRKMRRSAANDGVSMEGS